MIYGMIGFFDFLGVWKYFEAGLSAFLGWIGVDPKIGITAVMASPTLAMAQLQEIAAQLDPRLVVGAFVLASSGLPLSDIFAQIPAIWSANSDLTPSEALQAAVIGIAMRLITVAVIAYGLTSFIV